jgi:hypothetical protein
VKRGDAEVVVIRTGERTFIGEALKLVGMQDILTAEYLLCHSQHMHLEN